MYKLTISVTQEDIDQGKRSDCRYCPIARAGRRAFQLAQIPNDDAFTVTNNYLYPVVLASVVYDLPEEAINFISEFDNENPVVPFSFEIEVDNS